MQKCCARKREIEVSLPGAVRKISSKIKIRIRIGVHAACECEIACEFAFACCVNAFAMRIRVRIRILRERALYDFFLCPPYDFS